MMYKQFLNRPLSLILIGLMLVMALAACGQAAAPASETEAPASVAEEPEGPFEVVMGVAALAAGGIWLYNNWRKLPEMFNSAWDSAKNFLTFWKDESPEDKNVVVKPELKSPDGSMLTDLGLNPGLTGSHTDLNGPGISGPDFATPELPELRSIPMQGLPSESGEGKVIRDERKVVIKKIVFNNTDGLNENKIVRLIRETISNTASDTWGSENNLYDTAGVLG